jgi:hypothetical protein
MMRDLKLIKNFIIVYANQRKLFKDFITDYQSKWKISSFYICSKCLFRVVKYSHEDAAVENDRESQQIEPRTVEPA